MFCTMSNKHTKITRIKQKYSNDNQKARRKIIELQPQNFIYSFQVKLNKTTYLSFKHIMRSVKTVPCRHGVHRSGTSVFCYNPYSVSGLSIGFIPANDAFTSANVKAWHPFPVKHCDSYFRFLSIYFFGRSTYFLGLLVKPGTAEHRSTGTRNTGTPEQ